VANDINAWLPSQFKVRFPSLKTGGAVAYVPPVAYVKTVNVFDSGVGLPITNVRGNGFPLIVHDTTPATFTSGTTPTNQATLDALAVQMAMDYFNWRIVNRDYVFNGVVNPTADPPATPAPETLSAYDWLIEWRYTGSDATTRIVGAPFNGQAEEFQHGLPVSPCTVSPTVAWGTTNAGISSKTWGTGNITFDGVSFITVNMFNPYASTILSGKTVTVGKWDCNWLILDFDC
jgi:hypothetical protein